MLYQLTIDSSRTGTAVSGHGTPGAARAELHRYAVDADVYYQLIQATQPHSSYDLIELTDRARTTGCAVIEEMSMAAEALYYRAGEARRWIGEHRAEEPEDGAPAVSRLQHAAEERADHRRDHHAADDDADH